MTLTCELCDRPIQARRLCRTHYSQWWRAKNPERNKANSREWQQRHRAASRNTCGWCGKSHGLNAAGTTLDAEGLSHAQFLRHYGPPSECRDLVLVPRPPAVRRVAEPAKPTARW